MEEYIFNQRFEVTNFLLACYSENVRHYHNINHINYCATQFQNYFNNTPEHLHVAELVKNAIFYHDAIYNIWAIPGDNERNSAELLSNLHDSNYVISNKISIEYIQAAILATAKHTETLELTNSDKDITTAIMLDIDLSSLGDTWEIFDYNTKQIQKELEPKGLSVSQLNIGNIKFLYKLLNKERIYYTDYFHSICEYRARQNIIKSIAKSFCLIDDDDIRNEALTLLELSDDLKQSSMSLKSSAMAKIVFDSIITMLQKKFIRA